MLVGYVSRKRNSKLDDEAVDLLGKKWAVFLAITFGYGFYYVSRLSFSIVKKPLVDEGIFSASEVGFIGSALFFAYAIGKLVNGIVADSLNVRLFMTAGLLVSAAVNLALGFTTEFWVFITLWGINGWFQSFGAPSSVVSVSRWFSGKERGSFYGMWSTSHNIGEAVTFIATAAVVSTFGWMWGFRMSGIVCLIMCLFILRYLHEKPNPAPQKHRKIGLKPEQLEVFKNPAIWILAFASAFFYMTRYAINSWGVFYLEAEKGYSTIEAGSIISVNAIAGIAGTFFSGILSDKLFKGKRNLLALLFGFAYFLGIALFVYAPASPIFDTLSMILFGVALGVLLVYLGGLMAVDIASKKASGTALGLVGVASYVGAGMQDILSGILIDNQKQIINGVTVYDFGYASFFWVASSLASMLLATLVWNTKHHED